MNCLCGRTGKQEAQRKEYAREMTGAADNVLLVGINYDKSSKRHQCVIEEIHL